MYATVEVGVIKAEMVMGRNGRRRSGQRRYHTSSRLAGGEGEREEGYLGGHLNEHWDREPK